MDSFTLNPFQFHAEHELWREDRIGRAEPLRYPIRLQVMCFVGVLAASFGIYWFMEDKHLFRPVLPKQMPGDGRPHYTFEKAN